MKRHIILAAVLLLGAIFLAEPAMAALVQEVQPEKPEISFGVGVQISGGITYLQGIAEVPLKKGFAHFSIGYSSYVAGDYEKLWSIIAFPVRGILFQRTIEAENVPIHLGWGVEFAPYFISRDSVIGPQMSLSTLDLLFLGETKLEIDGVAGFVQAGVSVRIGRTNLGFQAAFGIYL